MHPDPLALLTLLSVPRIGSQRIRNLISRFKSPEAVLAASPRALIEVDGIEKNLAFQIKKNSDIEFAKEQLAKVKAAKASMLSFWNPKYPTLLKRTADPPVVLFCKGCVGMLNTQSIAIVGTRQPTEYAKVVTKNLTGELASKGLTIVSGMARGVDTLAHTETVRIGGKTVAVLGTGVDVVYPSENKTLAQNIQENGVLVSEFFMGEGPDAPHFPRRNRIISGLSDGTLIIEAGRKSGALITADSALEQGRDVFVVPGIINNPKAAGSNLLMQQGAAVVLSAQDILSQLNVKGPDESSAPTIKLSNDEDKVFQILSHEPKHIDEISQTLKQPTSFALGILLSLELKNIVHQLPGKMFARI
jgi:DNA processing protein